MTVDPTCPSRATRQGSRPTADVVEAPARARRRGHREHRSTPVQQAGRAVVDAPAAATKDASLATSRWCQSRDCRRRATPGCPCCCCWSRRSRYSCISPSPCLCRHCWGWGWGQEGEGEGPPADTAVPTVVGAEAAAAAEGSLLIRARSRTRRPVHGAPSGPARSHRVRGHCGRCGRRGTTATA
jgi:hypothetical protein